MILNISKVIKVPDVAMDLSFEEKIDFIESNFGKIKVLQPVQFHGTIMNDGKILYLNGNLLTTLELYCDRCTKSVETSLSIEIKEKFSKDFIDEEEMHIISGNEIDLNPIFIDSILLNMPMKSICSEECKGICPQCGQNLNEHICSCKNEEIDSRFAVLKTMFYDSK